MGDECPYPDDPEFVRAWEGVSTFDNLGTMLALGTRRNWRMGPYIAELHIPDAAPLTFKGPSRTGHVGIYDANGDTIGEELAIYLLGYVVRVVHGPTYEE